ncbi:unnamed protein product, partial [Cladocopium goreaui]
MLWAQEVRKVNTDILGQMQLKDLFKEYVEDYNTATMPSKKYYNIQVFEQQMSNKRRKKKAETVIDTALQSSLASFDDEKARRDEVLALRAKKQENQISSEVQRLRMNKEKAEDMKHQAMLKTQQSMLSKAGQVEAAGKISERLNPNKVDYAERRAKKLDGPVGFQPEGPMTDMEQEEELLDAQEIKESISDVSTDASLSRHSLSEDDGLEASSPVEKPSWGLWCFHLVLYYSCVLLTAVVLSIRSILERLVAGKPATQKLERPKAKLSWDMLTSADDPAKLVREVLPIPPDFPVPKDPKEDFTVTFGPCANLMIYTGGVACCLQRCPNFADVKPKLRFRGNSSGAFIAATMAAEIEIMQLLPEMLSWTERFRNRLWGIVGACSASITEIV